MNGQSGDERQDDSGLLIALLAEEGIELSRPSRIPARPRRDEHCLSFAQQRLWTLHQLYPHARSAYNIVIAVRLSGRLNTAALEAGLNAIFRRHEVLRSCVISHLGRPQVRVLESVTVPVPVIDLRGEAARTQRQTLTDYIETESQHVFDLERAPLARVTLLRTSEAEFAAVLTLHHLVADAWSMGVLIQELGQFYRAHLSGEPSPLADLTVQYGDFAEWQRADWQEGRLVAGLDYWKTQLAGGASLELPAGRSALQRTTFHGAVCPITIPRAVASALKRLGQQGGATLFMTVLAAFKVLLFRYTAQTDILVGTPVANRNRREIEPLIGFFVNTLVLRSRLSGEMTFRSLLGQVRDTSLSAYSAQDVPFDQIVHALALDRDAGPTPLFQVMFSLENAASFELDLPGLSVSPLAVETTSSKFDLTLALTASEIGDSEIGGIGEIGEIELSGGFEYSTELFDAGTVERMAQHFGVLLAAIVENPDRTLSALPMLPRREQDLVLLEWNRTARAYPANASIVDIFEAQAERSRDKVALEFGERSVTYRELNDRANRFASLLRAAGIQDEECVGICVNPSVELVIGLLGILKAGGVYVPLSPTDPPRRIRSIVAEARIRFVATQDRLESVLPADLVEAVSLERDSMEPGARSSARPARAIDGGRLAYIIYTSGSTGEPKGIAVPHRAVLRLVLNSNYIAVDEADRIAQASTFTFDAITFELWGALLNGACLVGVTRDVALSPTRLAAFLAQKRITTLFLTTALFNEIVRADRDAFAGLRQLLFGGEAVDPARVAEVLGARGPRRILHVYGPTETTTFATWFLVSHVPPQARTIPIGQPIANTEAYVLDDTLRPVPIGVPGELYLGGDGLARGYWSRPDLTADKFRPHPFSRRPGERVYKTGDWVRRLASGDIEFLGRIDQQVKIRGFRIEPAEIEAALLRHPDVKQAVVRAYRQGVQHRLVAYVVARPACRCDSVELVAHLRDVLPSYMVPAQIVRLDRLPMTSGGKIDRHALPAPDFPIAVASAYEAPRSAAEQLLVDIWKDVLGTRIVGVTDNYLELGGDSITAIQVASRLRRAGWALEPGDIIRRPTIASLAPRLRRVSEEHDAPVHVSGPVPLTPIQRWFFDTHSGDLHHFNQSVLLKARERLDETALRAALHALQQHHDALRMTYTVASRVEQRNDGSDHPLVLDVVNLRGGIDQSARLESHAGLLQASLSLEFGPLMKAAVYRLDEGDRLLVVVHHLVIDLMSWRILLEDLETAYLQARRGGPIDLGPKSDSYQLWAEEITRFSSSPEQLREIEYWSDQPLALAVPNHTNLFAHSAVSHTTLGEDDTRELLTGVHHAYHTEVNDLMLTALGRALKRWSGSPKTWITLEGHGREPLTRPLNLERTIGWFTSLVPFLLDLSGDEPGAQICEMKEALRRVPRKGVGYGILRYITPAEYRPAVHFLGYPEISFNYAGQFDGVERRGLFELSGESSGAPISPRLVRQHDLDISSMVVSGRLEISIVFNRERHRSDQVDQLLAYFVAELLAVAAHCRQRTASEKTPADFAAGVFSLESYRRFLQTYELQASEIDDIYPLSPMQEGLLFQILFDRASDAYFIQTVCRIEGPVDPEAFRSSWLHLSRRHAALRTAFVHEDLPRPLQVVFKERPPEVEVLDLRHLIPAEQSAFVIRCEAADRERRFDLQRDALMRVTLLRLTDTTSHLIWTYPHLILDGWCVGIIYREFLQTYQALSSRDRPALPPAPQYREYIDWLQTMDVTAARSYWASCLEGYEHVVTPGRGALSGQPQFGEWRTRTFELPAALCRRVKQVASDLSVTVNTIVQAAWGLVLSRYNNTRDVVFGTIVSGRPPELPGIEETIGVFINAMPVRIRFGRGQSVADLLQHVQRTALESDRWQHLPLAEILAQTACGRSLFDHLLVFENYPAGREPLRANAAGGPGLAVQFLASQDRTHYDLDLVIVPGEPIEIQIGYTTASYDHRQIERTAAHLETAIGGMAWDPLRSIDQVDILPERERHAVTIGFNATDRKPADDGTLVDMFEAQARRTPDALAVSYLDRALTYRTLGDEVDRLARRLVDQGVGPEMLVAISVERSHRMVVGMLAVLKAGGAYLPIDSASPEERLAFMLADANPAFLLTERGWSGRLPTAARTIYFDADSPVAGAAAPAGVASRAGPDNLAYVIYTSGTTGRPKGVMVEHRSLANGARAWMQYYGLDTFEVRMLQMAPFSSDVFTGDVSRCLTTGGALTMCPPEVRADPASIYELMAAHRISIVESTPALIVPLMDYIYESGLNHSFLKCLIVGSDTLPAAHYRVLTERFGHRMRIVNSYGVTEATIESSCFEQQAPRPVDVDETARWSGATPIGKPLRNTRYFVCDSDGRPLPIGFPGELHIGGDGITRGYLGRPSLTAERFVPDPGHDGERLYKSGDVARWLPDGNLDFIGRNDQQVKIRGYRIELSEIEHWLRQSPIVKQAVVRVKDYGHHDKELVAYFVSAEPDAEVVSTTARERRRQALLRFLATKLPDYMIPRVIVELAALPLTAHGKVDRARLPDPDAGGVGGSPEPAQNGQSAAIDAESPMTDEQRTLLRIWEEVLRIRSASAHDDFFQLGGHSLKAMQIVSRVRKHLGVRISYRDFFEHPTLAGLAGLVRTATVSLQSMMEAGDITKYHELVTTPVAPGGPHALSDSIRSPAAGSVASAGRLDFSSIQPRRPAADYALSAAQRRLWFVNQPKSQIAYNMPEAFVLEDDLDLEAVGRAFATLVERHEALRTAFVLVDEVPRQKILDTVPFFVRDIDVSGAADPEEQARQLAAAEAAAPFDLTTPPLLRAAVLRLGARRCVFLLVIHHIIGDGWSMNVLHREILALYTAYRAGRPNPLNPLRIQYKDYADWQNRQDFSADERYWLGVLAGVPDRLWLPSDFEPGAERDFAGRIEELRLGGAATAQLRAAAASHRTTLSNVVLSIFQWVLYRWTRMPDLCVGLSIANRNHPDLENLIGFFVNVLPIRVLLSPDLEFAELLAQVSARTEEAFEHQDYPFDQLIEALNPSRVGNQQPLVNVIYAFQNFQDVTIDIGLREAEPPRSVAGDDGGAATAPAIAAFPIPFDTSKFDLTLFVTDEGECLLLTLEYDTQLFRPETIRRCLGWMERACRDVA